MPDANGRVPPVAFSLSYEEWLRIFGSEFNVDGTRKGLDLHATTGGGEVQDAQPDPHPQMQDVLKAAPQAGAAEAHGGVATGLRGVRRHQRRQG